MTNKRTKLAGALVLVAIFCVLPCYSYAQGTVTVLRRWRQTEEPARTLWGYLQPTRGNNGAKKDFVYRLDLTCVVDTATSSMDAVIPLSDGTTDMLWTSDIAQVCTSSTANMTAQWDLELHNDLGCDILEYAAVNYAHDRETTRAQCLDLQFQPSVVGDLSVVVTNTTGTFQLSLFYYSER